MLRGGGRASLRDPFEDGKPAYLGIFAIILDCLTGD